jgi:hypothetical protein
VGLRELQEWAAFERTFGPITLHERIDQAAALVAWSIARSLGATEEGPEAFLPRWDESPGEAQSVEQMIALVRGLQRRQHG